MKILFRILLVLFVTALVAFAGVYWYYSPERVKARVASRLSQMLNRDVTLDAARVNWAGPAIEATGVRVSERRGFGARPFATAHRARVDFSLLPLILGRARLGELVLERPVVRVEIDEDGLVNAVDLWRDRKFALPVDRVRISDGALHYANAQTAQVWSMTGIGGYVRGEQAGEGLEINTEFSGQALGGSLSMQAVATTRSEGVDVAVSASLVDVPVEQVRGMLGWDVPLFGQADVAATVVVDTSFVLTRAKGTVQMAQGRLVQWEVLRRIFAGVEHLSDLATGDVALRDVAVVFDVAGRTVRLDGTRLIAADIPCRLTGTGEVGGALDCALDMEVPASQIQFGGFNLGALMGQAVTIPVRVYIRGTTAHPRIQVGPQ